MNLPELWEKYRLRSEAALAAQKLKWRGLERLLEAMNYSLEAGGKRLRPVLLLAAFDACGGTEPDPSAAACAVEYVHTYSLIHDDLPAMDNDDLRRGKPTSHVVFGEAIAILAGDALLAEAFRTLAEAYADLPATAAVMLRELAQAASSSGLVGGQVLDMQNCGQSGIEREALERLHAMKTGALIRCAVRMGALAAEDGEAALPALTRYAEKIGLAFQVTDDILDVTASREELGKSIGKDAEQAKTTYVDLMGLEAAQSYAAGLVTDALAELEPFGPRAAALREIADFIAGRRY